MHTSEEILLQLKQAGYKFTGKRKEIVDIFVENRDKFVTAKDIYEQVRKNHPNVSYDTIYRTLSLLMDKKVIEKMEFNDEASKYRLSCSQIDETDANHHHHHLVCLKCGSITIVSQCPMELLQEKFNDFTIVDHRFEIQGYCAACSEIAQ